MATLDYPYVYQVPASKRSQAVVRWIRGVVRPKATSTARIRTNGDTVMWPFKSKPASPPPLDSHSLPEGLLESLQAAYLSGGRYFVIVAHHDPTMAQPNRYWRRSHGFPVTELDNIVGLLQQDVASEKHKAGAGGRNGQGRVSGLLPKR